MLRKLIKLCILFGVKGDRIPQAHLQGPVSVAALICQRFSDNASQFGTSMLEPKS